MRARLITILGAAALLAILPTTGAGADPGHGRTHCVDNGDPGGPEVCLYLNFDYNGSTDNRVIHLGQSFPGVSVWVDLHHDINPGFGDAASSWVNKFNVNDAKLTKDVDPDGTGSGAHICLNSNDQDPDLEHNENFNNEASAIIIKAQSNPC